jgi:hypothetical protein
LGFYPFQKWRIKYPLAWNNNVENLAEIDFKKMWTYKKMWKCQTYKV